jgi:hypothetical protein
MDTPPTTKAAPGRRAAVHSLQARIVLFFVILLVTVQGALMFLVSVSGERIARSGIDQELAVGERVFRNLIEQNARQLTDALPKAGVAATPIAPVKRLDGAPSEPPPGVTKKPAAGPPACHTSGCLGSVQRGVAGK